MNNKFSVVSGAGPIRLSAGLVLAVLLGLLLAVTSARAQTDVTVSGCVTDPYGNALPGMTITLAVSANFGGFSRSCVSDAHGNYRLDIQAGTTHPSPAVMAISAAIPGHVSPRNTIFTGNPGMDYQVNFTASGRPLILDVGSAEAVGQTAATLNATNNPGNLPTGAFFAYGLTSCYGRRTPVSAEAGSGNLAITAGLAGLLPGLTYHYCLVATNCAGAVQSHDQTFTTLPPILARIQAREQKGAVPADRLRTVPAGVEWLDFTSSDGQAGSGEFTTASAK